MGVKRGGMSSGNLCIEETKLRVLIRGEKKTKTQTGSFVFLGGITSKTKSLHQPKAAKRLV